MKVPAYIFIIVLSFLTLQPAFSSDQKNIEVQCCKKDFCNKRGDEKPDKKNNCGNNGCNPFMACAYGNFFLIGKSSICFTYTPIAGKKIIALNDNRIATMFSDCWHPPETT